MKALKHLEQLLAYTDLKNSLGACPVRLYTQIPKTLTLWFGLRFCAESRYCRQTQSARANPAMQPWTFMTSTFSLTKVVFLTMVTHESGGMMLPRVYFPRVFVWLRGISSWSLAFNRTRSTPNPRPRLLTQLVENTF